MGRPDARDLAVEVIARYQGTALLTSTFRDPGLMEGEAAASPGGSTRLAPPRP